MSFTLDLRVKRAEGALVRVLGLMGRRGYEVSRLVAWPTDDGASLDVTVVVESDRPADVLARHVSKLFDVERVDLKEAAKWTA